MAKNQLPFTAEQLDDAIPEVAAYEDYSGRAMFGETCFGVVHDGAGLSLGLGLLQLVEEADPIQVQALALKLGVSEPREIVERLLADACGDQMGLSSITYFPGWELRR